MSSAELARRAGLSKVTLSQLEAGRGNPTIETLDALAIALPIPLVDLLVRDTEPGPVFVPGTVLSANEVGRELLRRISSGNSLEIWRLETPQNAAGRRAGPDAGDRVRSQENLHRLGMDDPDINQGPRNGAGRSS